MSRQRGRATLLVSRGETAGLELGGAALEGALARDVSWARPDSVEVLLVFVARVGEGQGGEAQDGGLCEEHFALSDWLAGSDCECISMSRRKRIVSLELERVSEDADALIMGCYTSSRMTSSYKFVQKFGLALHPDWIDTMMLSRQEVLPHHKDISCVAP